MKKLFNINLKIRKWKLLVKPALKEAEESLPYRKIGISSRGFTLVELLVVIGVLGVLATGLLISIDPAQQLAKARNASRKNSLKQLADALDRYRARYETYPVSPNGWCSASGTYWASGCPGGDTANWIPGLVASGEIKSLPQDPRVGQVFLPCNDGVWTTYTYFSNGTDYKIIAHCTLEGPPPANDPFLDPARPTYSWAVYTAGASGW